jgi:cation:H+ antiporter
MEKIKLPEATFKIILGLVGLFIGGQLIVDNAVNLSLLFGVSQSLVGITIVSIGTSLPEIATSVSAALKKKTDLIVGNVMGSNIFNLLLVLGINAMINPIEVHSDFAFDITIVITASFLLFVFTFIGKKQVIEKYQASMLLSFYIFYIIYTIFKG